MAFPARALLRCGLAAVALASGSGCVTDHRAAPVPTHVDTASGSQSRSVRVLDLDGAPRDLWTRSDAAATVVLFTRTDCPVSNRFAPEIRDLYRIYHPAGVEFYLVYVDPLETPDAIRRHLSEYKYPCQGLRDPEHMLVAYCQATTTPEAAVFGPDRTMTYRGRISDLYEDLGSRRSEATRHDLAEAIDATVHHRPVATPRTTAVGCVIADVKR